MLKIFRRDIALQLVIIAATAAAFWLPAFMDPQPLPIFDGGPLYRLLAGWMSPLTAVFAGMLLVIAEGFFINRIFFNYKMVSQSTLLPMLMFLIAMSIGADQLTLTPTILGMFFLVLAVDQQMISTTLLSLPISKTFGASALVALASLCCPPLSVFLLTIVFNMFNFRQYRLNEWMMIVFGFAAPFIILETYYFLIDQLLYRNYLLIYDITDIRINIGGTSVQWAASATFVVAFLIAFSASLLGLSANTINFSKNLTSAMFFLIGGLALSFYGRLIPLASQCFAIPFSLTATLMLYGTKRHEWIWSLATILTILLFIICNYI